jgi:hypothetical protein
MALLALVRVVSDPARSQTWGDPVWIDNQHHTYQEKCGQAEG